MPRSARDSVRVRIGTRYAGQDGTGSLAAQLIGDAVMREVRSQTQSNYLTETGRPLAERLARAILRELGWAGGTAAKMMGTTSGRNWQGETEIKIPNDHEQEIYLSWRNLSHRSQRDQMMAGSTVPRFFLRTGQLQQEVRTKVGPQLQALQRRSGNKSTPRGITRDGVTVRLVPFPDHTPKKPRLKIAEIDIDILTALRTSSLSYAAGIDQNTVGQVLERRLGFSKAALQKLKGHDAGRGYTINHRPVIQPVLAFYLQVRLPAVIQRTIASAKSRVKGYAP